MLKRLSSAALAALLLFMPLPKGASAAGPDEAARAQAAIGKRPSPHTLVDRHGKRFSLSGLFGKPLVVSYIYTSCPHVCPTIMTNMRAALEKAGADFGRDFTALTIGFDVKNDTPKALDAYAAHFAEGLDGWRFATADKKTIDALAKELGFYFRELPEGGFDHINMVTVIDRDGVVFRQIYGLDFSADDVLEAIRLAQSGYGRLKPGQRNAVGIIDRVKLFCYRYDDASGKYRFAYGPVIALSIGVILQLATVVWLLRRLKNR
ncbi:MAG: SCO family protein [Deltaproteobacteria bacterium]|nr:SCO family protein [Deltaproteobacteria bacterium]